MQHRSLDEALTTAINERNVENFKRCIQTYLVSPGIENRDLILIETLYKLVEENSSPEMVQFMLDNKVHLEVTLPDGLHKGCTALYYSASLKGNSKVTKFLLSQGVKVNAVVYPGRTPLHSVASKGYDQVIEHLLEYGADVHATLTGGSAIGYTPLHCAASLGHHAIVKRLLEQKADPNAATPDDLTPLHLAAQEGHYQVAASLIAAGAKVNAALNEGPAKGYTPLHYASRMGQREMVVLLLAHHADPNAVSASGITPISYAIEKDHSDVAKLLIEGGADVHAILKGRPFNGFTALQHACKQGHTETVKLLLKYDANVNATTFQGITLLHLAVIFEHKEIVQDLLRYGASVNEVVTAGEYKDYNTLHIAAISKQPEIIHLLLQNGADARALMNGESAEVLAIRAKKTEAASILKACTDLYLACDQNNLHAMDRLVKAIPELAHSVLPNKDTLLHQAVSMAISSEPSGIQKILEFVKLLLSHQIDKNKKGNKNKSAIELAYEHSQWALQDILLSDFEKQIHTVLLNDNIVMDLLIKLMSGQRALREKTRLPESIVFAAKNMVSNQAMSDATHMFRIVLMETMNIMISFLAESSLISDFTLERLASYTKQLQDDRGLSFLAKFKLKSLPFSKHEEEILFTLLHNLDQVNCNQLNRKEEESRSTLVARTMTERALIGAVDLPQNVLSEIPSPRSSPLTHPNFFTRHDPQQDNPAFTAQNVENRGEKRSLDLAHSDGDKAPRL